MQKNLHFFTLGNIFLYMKILNIVIYLFISSVVLVAQRPEFISSVEWAEESGNGILEVEVIFPEGFHQTYNPDFFTFEILDSENTTWGDISYDVGVEEDGYIQYYDRTSLRRDFQYRGSAEELRWTIEVKYQLCNDSGVCLLPKQEQIPLTLSIPETQSAAPVSSQGSSFWLYLLLAFVGGVLLNIMPCVLPLLSVKALNLVHQQDKSRKSILMNSWAYALGILASMMLLAILVGIIQRSGSLLGWGFQFQNPWFLFLLISFIFAFSLSLFEWYIISSPIKSGQKKREGYGGSFLTGIFAVLVATPCTAPFMGTALGFAFTQPPALIMGIFLTMGLGFSLPFLLLGLFPAIIHKLPKPGNWMITFQKIMGFVLIATVLYLLQSLYSQIGKNIFGVLWFLLSLAISLWILGVSQNPRIKRSRKWLLFIPVLLIPLLSGFFFLDLQPELQEQNKLNQNQEIFSPERVEELLEDEKAVFLEFTADWCTTCKRNHRNVLDKQEFQDLITRENIYYLVGDYTQEDEDIAQWLRRFDRAGVPLYVYFAPGREPYVFPEILTMKLVQEVLLSQDA